MPKITLPYHYTVFNDAFFKLFSLACDFLSVRKPVGDYEHVHNPVKP